ncbi:precorrin-3B C(17)-methyltransferase [Methanobrevibacter filiformis]|uniref:Cobalt-precorrin-3B C(17)-methyltransferase n=1 Tax=Methanobrevibacter filiformis TaxID=55758 RepID=A0A166FEP5_9EURY|nr:precorrin-3B C(17)-methyltransferase [Methanobrevibacter filiformis]KZX17600.1 cobalt-precorrin-3B C(17)-methyltransferase [Methanobrevibacter filiformis]
MINIIGIGPNRDNITEGALKAISESDVIVGYKKYIDSIEDLIDDKEIIKKGMGDEIARVELAISKSLEGHKVALISSGDPGVFGMANVLFQILSKYDGLEVKVYPGVTATNYAASLLGAPLHDFVAISLSDILTPLEEIENKIKHAILGEFIIAIYNPISKTRKEPFRLFKKLLNELKKPETPIGIVDSTYSPSKVTITTVNELNEKDINMSTTLIVGNSLTYIQDSYLITPRGYVVSKDIHPMAKDFYLKFLNGSGSSGSNTTCEFYPCHNSSDHQCDFCFCPFYPCGDGSTGGKWIKDKNVWSCEDCSWIHEKETVDCIKTKLKDILTNVNDLKSKKKQLLKLRRFCLLNKK